MKRITFGLLLIAVSGMSQETESFRKIQDHSAKTTIIHLNGKLSRGYAYAIADDSIRIYNSAFLPDQSNMQMDVLSGGLKTVAATDIQKIKFREKKQFQQNVIVGFLLGTLAGIIVGHIHENGIAIDVNENITVDFTHPPEKTNYPKIILRGAAIGTATGIITGCISKKFILKGKNERFRENRIK